MRSLVGAVVEVRGRGEALVLRINNDDSVHVLCEWSGTEARINRDDISVLPVDRQPDSWIIEQLVDAWQPLLQQSARHAVAEILEWSRLEMMEKRFEHYLNLSSFSIPL